MPWNYPTEKPSDYYERQSKTITYFKEDLVQGKVIRSKIDIEIPKVEEGKNRHRPLSVKVDGIPVIFKDNSILDMGNTFIINDVNFLMHIMHSHVHPKNNSALLQTITPFFHYPYVGGDIHYEFNQKSNGDIIKLFFPYIQEMCALKNDSIKRELLIPVVTKGDLHHWNLCLLSIDENNIPSLSYIESANLFGGEYAYQWYVHYMMDYKDYIMVSVNFMLQYFNYPNIEVVNYSQAKQFSQEGCGIAMSFNIQKILEGNYPSILCNSNLEAGDVPDSTVINNLSSAVSIEEDSLRRVELAFKIQARASIIAEGNFDEKQVEKKNLLCSELLSCSKILAIKAKEAFGFFKPSQKSTGSSTAVLALESDDISQVTVQ